MRTIRTLILCLAVGVGALLSGPLVARAQAPADIERGQTLLQEGDFEGARTAFESAMEAPNLSRDQFIHLLEGMALLNHAEGNEVELNRALTAIASIASDHRFGPEYPRNLSESALVISRDTQAQLRVVVSPTVLPVGAGLEVRVEFDPANLVRTLVVFHREGDAAWQQSPPEGLQAGPDQELQYYVEAQGPGGVVLASTGSASAPRSLTGNASGAVAPADDNTLLWVAIGVGATLVVAGGVTAAILLTGGSTTTDNNRPALPVLTF